jgi:hypothetical protein
VQWRIIRLPRRARLEEEEAHLLSLWFHRLVVVASACRSPIRPSERRHCPKRARPQLLGVPVVLLSAHRRTRAGAVLALALEDHRCTYRPSCLLRSTRAQAAAAEVLSSPLIVLLPLPSHSASMLPHQRQRLRLKARAPRTLPLCDRIFVDFEIEHLNFPTKYVTRGRDSEQRRRGLALSSPIA